MSLVTPTTIPIFVPLTRTPVMHTVTCRQRSKLALCPKVKDKDQLIGSVPHVEYTASQLPLKMLKYNGDKTQLALF